MAIRTLPFQNICEDAIFMIQTAQKLQKIINRIDKLPLGTTEKNKDAKGIFKNIFCQKRQLPEQMGNLERRGRL